MAGLIPQSFIDDLLNRTDIIDVVSSRIQLKKTGNCSQVTKLKIHWIERSDMATGRV